MPDPAARPAVLWSRAGPNPSRGSGRLDLRQVGNRHGLRWRRAAASLLPGLVARPDVPARPPDVQPGDPSLVAYVFVWFA